ncbi:MAG: HD domain-containing phosphohydrolase [Anaerofustis sp.]
MGKYTIDSLSELLLEYLPEGIILSDENGDILYVNPAAEHIRNIRKDEKIGQNILNCHKEESREKVARAFAHIKETPNADFHRTVFDKINAKVYQNTYAPLYDEKKSFCGMAVISRDITKERESEEKRVLEARNQEIAIANLQAQYQNILLAAMETLSDVMEAKDVYTDGHSKRVAKFAMKLYEHIYGLTDVYYDIEFAAKLHDIGKVCIPEHIITKPEHLSAEEFEVIKNHPAIASNLVKKIDPGNRITPAIRHHHERYDGKGYPDRLEGEDIPLGARIITLADSYDAMRSNRPYRSGLSVDQCVNEIRRNEGTQFDPEFAEAFCELIRTGSID